MAMPQPDDNPVVLLSAGEWHIVESSHGSMSALCGRPIRDRQAHSRLKTIGREHVCPRCLKVHDAMVEVGP